MWRLYLWLASLVIVQVLLQMPELEPTAWMFALHMFHPITAVLAGLLEMQRPRPADAAYTALIFMACVNCALDSLAVGLRVNSAHALRQFEDDVMGEGVAAGVAAFAVCIDVYVVRATARDRRVTARIVRAKALQRENDALDSEDDNNAHAEQTINDAAAPEALYYAPSAQQQARPNVVVRYGRPVLE